MTGTTTSSLTFGYHDRLVGVDIDWSSPDRSFTVIVGPNACGKSTLLRALSRLLKPASGQVLLDGKAIIEQSSGQVAKRLGLLPQTSIAPDGITVADLVARDRCPRPADRAYAVTRGGHWSVRGVLGGVPAIPDQDLGSRTAALGPW